MYVYKQFDPRTIPAASATNEAIFGLGSVLGIEVTVPALAARCDLGNVDHHGEGTTSDTPAACEQALVADLPEEGTVMATVRCDADSITAMAVFAARATGIPVDQGLVSMVGEMDRLGPQAPRRDNRVIAIARVSADFKRPLDQRVAWVADLLAGQDKASEIEALVAARNAEFAAAAEASEVSMAAEGRICVVTSTHQFATNLGYERAQIVVAMNPKMLVNFRDPSQGTYVKYTVCRFDSHTPLDLEAATAELNAAEGADGTWGGQPNIKGSPQGVSSTLDLETVVEIVEKYLL